MSDRLNDLKAERAKLKARLDRIERDLLENWSASHQQDGPDDEEQCADCGGKGWDCYVNIDVAEHGLDPEWVEIQRCDTCRENATDEEAGYCNFDHVALVYLGPDACPTHRVCAKGPLTTEASEAVKEHHQLLFLDEMMALSQLTDGGEA